MKYALRAAATVLVLGICALAAAGCGFFGGEPEAEESAQTDSATATVALPTATAELELEPTTPSILDTDVFATGEIEAVQDAEIVFQVSGQIEEVLVDEGQEVQAGDVLAVLDTRPFDQDVRDAEAALVSAQADEISLTEDPLPADAAAAQSAIARASGQLAQVVGQVTPEDIAAAQARVEEANAALIDLQEGADPLDVQAAETRYNQAVINLESQRDQLSQAKTQAEIAVQQAAEQVRSAQTAYSAAYWDWQYVRDYGKAPPRTESEFNPSLSEHSEQEYRDRLTQAEIDLQVAEDNLTSAEERLDEARINEVNGVQAAEAQVQEAQISLDQVLEPAEEDALASARARVADAQASLASLQGQGRAGSIAAAQASVSEAQANLDRLYSDPTESQSLRAEAGIARAEANLAQALLNREYAQLLAPFDGEVAVINIDPGDLATTGGGEGAMRIVDLSELLVEVDVTDADIARVRVGQEAEIVPDALPDEVFLGTVVFVSPTAEVDAQGVTTYPVKIQLNDSNLPLRVGMTVSVTIKTDSN